MKKEIFAVCDPEAEYAGRLADFLNTRQGASFEIQAFTSVNNICEFAGKKHITLLLIASQLMCERVRELSIDKIMILSEGEVLEELTGYPAVYKYQASDSLIGEVMERYAADPVGSPSQVLKSRMRVIGVYSPVRRVLKTSFALTLGQVLARNRGVLYLNLEPWSGFERLMKREFTQDLSDLMYFVSRGGEGLVYKLQSLVQSFENLDYLPPFLSPEDLKNVSCQDWQTLLEAIEGYSAYDTVILDMDESADGFLSLLGRCHVVYMPVKEDNISAAKLHQFDKVLSLSGCEDLSGRIRKIKLPFHSSFGTGERYVEQLIWGELGDYVRKLVRDEQTDGEFSIRGVGECE